MMALRRMPEHKSESLWRTAQWLAAAPGGVTFTLAAIG